MTNEQTYKEALEEIAGLSGLTLLGCGEDDCNMFPHCPELEQRAHTIGANKAFEQAADIAKAALSSVPEERAGNE